MTAGCATVWKIAWLIAAIPVSSIIVGGCSTYRDPQIKVTSAAISQGSAEATGLQFELELDNPNAIAVELLEFNYDVSLDGRKIYSGRHAAQATLQSGGTRRIVLPAVLNTSASPAEADPASWAYVIKGSLLYVTPGAVAETLFDMGLRKPRAGFTGRGSLAPPEANAPPEPK